MANFIAMVYATLKNEGIDTKGLSTDEAVEKFEALQKKTGGKEGHKEPTPAENRKLAAGGGDAKEKVEQSAKGVTSGQKVTDIGTYKGYGIDKDFYGNGEYSVQFQGDDYIFETEEEAKKFIDEQVGGEPAGKSEGTPAEEARLAEKGISSNTYEADAPGAKEKTADELDKMISDYSKEVEKYTKENNPKEAEWYQKQIDWAKEELAKKGSPYKEANSERYSQEDRDRIGTVDPKTGRKITDSQFGGRLTRYDTSLTEEEQRWKKAHERDNEIPERLKELMRTDPEFVEELKRIFGGKR